MRIWREVRNFTWSRVQLFTILWLRLRNKNAEYCRSRLRHSGSVITPNSRRHTPCKHFNSAQQAEVCMNWIFLTRLLLSPTGSGVRFSSTVAGIDFVFAEKMFVCLLDFYLCGDKQESDCLYSRTRLIRHFFVGPGRISIFCVHFCSSNSEVPKLGYMYPWWYICLWEGVHLMLTMEGKNAYT